SGGSIHPATWSAMLAARAEGVGASMTSVFLFRLDDVLEILKVPKEEGWLFASCVSFGYPTGRWGVAPRRPVHEVAYRNRWGEPVGFEVSEPLWPEAGAGRRYPRAGAPGPFRPKISRWPGRSRDGTGPPIMTASASVR